MQYCRPATVGEALDVLAASDGRARVLVGGTDLLVGVRRRPLDETVLVDIKAATDLPAAIEVGPSHVRIGPTATMTSLSSDPRVASWYPALVEASKVVGSVAIRNRATLVGNICNASPAADTAPALLVYGATVTIAGPSGERTVALTDFFDSPGRTACGPDELVVGVDLAVPEDGHRSAFQRLTRRRGVDLATVSVAAGVSADARVTLALGAVGPTPLLSETSRPIDLADVSAIDAEVDRLVAIASPISDVRAGERYRSAMTAVLAKRAVRAATQSGEGVRP